MIRIVNGRFNNRIQSKPDATELFDAYTCAVHGDRVMVESENIEPPQGRIVEMDEVVMHSVYCLDCEAEELDEQQKEAMDAS